MTVDEKQLEIERFIEKRLKTISKRIIKQLQKQQTDNLGIGRYVRNTMSYEEWEAITWSEDMFPEAKINVEYHVQIKGFGAIK